MFAAEESALAVSGPRFVPKVERAPLAVASAEGSAIVVNLALPPVRKFLQKGILIRKSVRVARGKGYQKWQQDIFPSERMIPSGH